MNDGWCDAPDDPNYNRLVSLPYPASAEHLWRDDNVYDLIAVLGYNDDPVVPGKGSAIFLHIARSVGESRSDQIRFPIMRRPRAVSHFLPMTRWRHWHSCSRASGS